MKERTCKFCNKIFTPRSNRQIYCDGPHYQSCPVCGKSVLVTNNEKLKYPPTACSYECRVKRTQATSLERYGILAPGNNSEARKKAKETSIKNNGVPYAMQSKDIRNKSKQTMMQKYGVENASHSKEFLEKRRKTCKERYGDTLPFNQLECYEKQHETMLKRYGVPYFCITDKCIEAQGKIISEINKKFMNQLQELNLNYVPEFKIENRSYDICLPDYKTLIEIDPTYTHSTSPTHWNTSTNKYYHRDKTQLAEDNGFRCIHVFDWDDWDKIVDLLRPTKRVFARKCTIYKLNPDIGDEFLNKYHLQRTCRGQLLYLGLVFDDELLQVMTFGKSRYDKSYDVELLRLCTKPGYTIVGGASRLFSYATNEYGLSNIISYCDRSKFSGNVYEKMGMTLKRITPPQEIWSKGNEKITANLLRARGYDQLFGTEFGKGTSNEELMLSAGFLPVYDCGQRVYVF